MTFLLMNTKMMPSDDYSRLEPRKDVRKTYTLPSHFTFFLEWPTP